MSESKVAGMFRPRSILPKTNGDYFCRFIQENGIKSEDIFTFYSEAKDGDGWEWECEDLDFEWLDESPEAIAEAKQEKLIQEMSGEIKRLESGILGAEPFLEIEKLKTIRKEILEILEDAITYIDPYGNASPKDCIERAEKIIDLYKE